MNNYYRTQDIGGWNPCIYGNTERLPLDWNQNVLPNCVGYSVARFNEMANTGDCRYLGNSNANWFMNWASAQGLKTGFEPKVGAVMVWDDGYCGHVANVEELIDNGGVKVSESGWNASSYMWYANHYPDHNWCAGDDFCWMGDNYRFLGFIYNPAFEIDKSLPTPVEENKEVDQLKVNCNDTMRVRLGHNLDSEIIGFATEGFYNILQKCDDVDYTWCEVEKNKWIAIMPPYCDYISKMQETHQNQEKGQDSPIIPEEPKTPENGQDNDEIELINRDKENPLVEFIKWLVKLIVKILKKEE